MEGQRGKWDLTQDQIKVIKMRPYYPPQHFPDEGTIKVTLKKTVELDMAFGPRYSIEEHAFREMLGLPPTMTTSEGGVGIAQILLAEGETIQLEVLKVEVSKKWTHECMRPHQQITLKHQVQFGIGSTPQAAEALLAYVENSLREQPIRETEETAHTQKGKQEDDLIKVKHRAQSRSAKKELSAAGECSFVLPLAPQDGE